MVVVLLNRLLHLAHIVVATIPKIMPLTMMAWAMAVVAATHITAKIVDNTLEAENKRL